MPGYWKQAPGEECKPLGALIALGKSAIHLRRLQGTDRPNKDHYKKGKGKGKVGVLVCACVCAIGYTGLITCGDNRF